MPKPPKPNLKSIVAATLPAAAPPEAKVVPFRSEASSARGTLKERTKQLSVYLEPAVYDQLREIAHAERTKLHPLMLEALDLLFSHRGALSIRELEERSADAG